MMSDAAASRSSCSRRQANQRSRQRVRTAQLVYERLCRLQTRCRNYNFASCSGFPDCVYRHVCLRYQRSHKLPQCPEPSSSSSSPKSQQRSGPEQDVTKMGRAGRQHLVSHAPSTVADFVYGGSVLSHVRPVMWRLFGPIIPAVL